MPRVVEDRVDGDLVAVHDVEHAIGQTGFGVQLGDQVRRARHPLARLEDEGVAGGDRDRVHPERHHDREVERRDPGDDTERLAERVRVDATGHLVGELALEQLRDAADELDDLAAADDLAASIVDRLAVLGGDDLGQVELMLHEQLAEGEHHPGARRHRRLAPRLECVRRRLHRSVDVLGAGELHLGLRRAERRVVNIAYAASGAG